MLDLAEQVDEENAQQEEEQLLEADLEVGLGHDLGHDAHQSDVEEAADGERQNERTAAAVMLKAHLTLSRIHARSRSTFTIGAVLSALISFVRGQCVDEGGTQRAGTGSNQL
mgnify:CR=1 FL=1